MDFASTEQPEGLPDGLPAEQPAGQPAYVATVQPVVTSARRSRSTIVGAVLAGAIGLTAVAVGLASTGAPAAAAPAVANAQGVLLGADTGAWIAPNGGAATAPNVTGMLGNQPGSGFGPGAGMGRGGPVGGRGMFASISITAINGTNLALTTADGWTRTIDATGASVQRSGQTVDLSTLKVGDSITFDQARQTDGTFKITAIRVVLPRAAGTVKSVSGSSVTLTQRDGTAKEILLTSLTTYKLAGAASSWAALTVGAVVNAEGTTATNGTFTATLVNIQAARAPRAARAPQAGGTVTATTTGSITVKTRDGSSLTITVDATTTYQVAGVKTATLSDVKVGATVMAEGTRNTDGTFSATVVRAFAAGTGPGPWMRGDHGMPWGQRTPGTPGTPGTQPTPAPAGTTN
jgi:hypothetical protein